MIVCFFLSFNFISSQSFTATYTIKSVMFEDNEINEGYKNEIKSLFKNDIDTLKFNLLFKKNKFSFFYANTSNRLKNDNSNTIDFSKISAENTGLYFVDIEKGIIQNEREDFGSLFIVQDSIKDIKWEISNEQKLIDKYLCFKAIYKTTVTYNIDIGKTITKPRTVIAWFCPELPYSAGPLGFTGLPGLILELKNFSAVYLLKSFRLENDINLVIPKKGKLLSRSNYITEYNKLYDFWEYENMPEELKVKK